MCSFTHLLLPLAEIYRDPKLCIPFGADFLMWPEGTHTHTQRLKVLTSVFLMSIFYVVLKYSLDLFFFYIMKSLLFGNVASCSLYPRSGFPSSANSGGPGIVVPLAESRWNWQRWKAPFIVIHTSQAWQYLWAPSGSVIFLTLSLRAAWKRWKRPSPWVSLTFLEEWTDVGQSAIYFEQETKVLLKRRVPCWVYWNSPVVYNVHCNPLAGAIPHPPLQGCRTSDLVSSLLEETFRAPIQCYEILIMSWLRLL